MKKYSDILSRRYLWKNRQSRTKPKLLAIASGGGHWAQLLRLLRPIEDLSLIAVTVDYGYSKQIHADRFYKVIDADLWKKRRLIVLALQVLYIILKERPKIVLTTGAAPGFFGIVFGKWINASTIWVDSIANSDEPSLCCSKVGRHADLWLTQWENVAKSEGPYYFGRIV